MSLNRNNISIYFSTLNNIKILVSIFLIKFLNKKITIMLIVKKKIFFLHYICTNYLLSFVTAELLIS